MESKKKPMYSYFFTEQEYRDKLGQVHKKEPEGALEVGAVFPDVVLVSNTGNIVKIAEIAKTKNVVLFFYPGDKEGLRYPELMGCTPQACSFRDAMSQFAKERTTVYGVSFQSPERQKDFAQREKLNFLILNDTDQVLASALGISVWQSKSGQKFPARQTYVIVSGKINAIYKEISADDVATHVSEVLSYIKSLPKVEADNTRIETSHIRSKL